MINKRFQKLVFRFMLALFIVPVFSFYLSFDSFAAAEEWPEDDPTTEYNPDIQLYDGKPNQKDWTEFSNVVSRLVLIAAGVELSYNVAEEIRRDSVADEDFNWARVLGKVDLATTPIYRADQESGKVQRIDDVNEIFGLHVGELYLPADASLGELQPLFTPVLDEVHSNMDNPDSYSWPWPFVFTDIGDYALRIQQGGTSNSWGYTIPSDCDGYCLELYENYVLFQDFFTIDNGYISWRGGELTVHRVKDGVYDQFTGRKDDFEYSRYNPTIQLNPNTPVIVFDETQMPLHVSMYVNGQLVESWDDYSREGNLYSQYSDVDSIQAGDLGLGRILSNIPAALSDIKASALAAADADALKRARKQYQEDPATDPDAALDPYIRAIQAALEDQAEAQEKINANVEGISIGLGKVLDWLKKIYYAVIAIPDDIKAVGNTVKSILDKLLSWNFSQWFADLLAAIVALPGQILESFSQFLSDISAFWKSIVSAVNTVIDTLSGIASDILSIPETLIQGLLDFFIMNEASHARVQAKLDAAFAPVEWIPAFVDQFKIALFGFFSPVSEPPKIPIHFGNATSKYNWGGDMYILDMSQYAPYKPIGDGIIIFFAWLLFGWHLFKTAPSILSGGNGLVYMEDAK